MTIRRVYLDCETRSRIDIWSSGAYVYASDKSTELLCLAYAVDSGPVRIITHDDIFTYPLSDPFEELRELANAKDTVFCAHSAIFEQFVYQFKLQDRFNLPRIAINRWRCTAAKALAVGLPKSLAEAGMALGTKHTKDLRGRSVMLKLCKPDSKGNFIEDPSLFKELETYCAQDVETERDIDIILPELSPAEQLVWFEDQLINQRGVQVDTDTLSKIEKFITVEEKRLKAQIHKLTNGKLEGVSRRAAVLEYLGKKGCTLPDFTKATVESAIQTGKLSPEVLEILRVRQQLGLTSTAKYAALRDALCADGRLRDTFVYHAASTGRWGGKLVQLQNLPKGSFPSDIGIEMLQKYDHEMLLAMYPNIMELLSSCVRGMFIAAPGHDLIIADYSAIEARVLMWFCDEVRAVKMFEEGADIYVDMAKRISPSAPRQLGKQAVLACGYGMGPDKFQATCQTYGIKVDPMLAATAVKTYRGTYPKVPQMWYAQERAAVQALTKGGAVPCGRVTWEKRGDFLWCKLPSGRSLAYHKPEIRTADEMAPRLSYMTTDSMTKKYTRKDTYGGKIIENCLDKNTLVYTIRGCVPIIDVKQGDKVWDGVEWVNTDGVVKRGIKETGWLGGIKLTPDHQILVGKSWKRAIDLDEESWRGALKPGLRSVALSLFTGGLEIKVPLFASVCAAQDIVSKLALCLEGPSYAANAGIKKPRINGENMPGLCLQNYWACGYTATRGWFHDVLIPQLKHIKTMVNAALVSILFGFRTVWHFWTMPKNSLGGIIPLWTWTELTTTWGISREILGSLPGELIAGIAAIQRGCNFNENAGPLWIFGRTFALFGKAIILSYTILTEVKRSKKLWRTTEKQEEVYDLLNCGPRQRFTIISSEGPIIVHNCIQATARDLLASALLGAERKGYKPVMHVHDEIVVEVPEGVGSTGEFEKIICAAPAWAKGCPIHAEAERVKRYRKG